jgi:hypothetical protein
MEILPRHLFYDFNMWSIFICDRTYFKNVVMIYNPPVQGTIRFGEPAYTLSCEKILNVSVIIHNSSYDPAPVILFLHLCDTEAVYTTTVKSGLNSFVEVCWSLSSSISDQSVQPKNRYPPISTESFSRTRKFVPLYPLFREDFYEIIIIQ